MGSISSIENLIKKLNSSSVSDYKSILSLVNIDLKAYTPYLKWSKDKYTRNHIYKNSHFELLIMCWKSLQSTPPHNHGGMKCWLCLIQGELKEVIYQRTSSEIIIKKDTHKLAPRQVAYIDDYVGYHSLENINKSETISLHLYAKPIKSFDYYDSNKKVFLNKPL